MKKTTIIISFLLLIGVCGYSQTYGLTDTAWGSYSTSSLKGFGNVSLFPVTDTNKVIMLYCDTSNLNSSMVWMLGYEVRKIVECVSFHQPTLGGSILRLDESIWEHQEYLDIKKQPITKNKIVWLSKQL